MAGTCLYLVGHYETHEEAENAARAHRASSGERTYVYAPPRAPRVPKSLRRKRKAARTLRAVAHAGSRVD